MVGRSAGGPGAERADAATPGRPIGGRTPAGQPVVVGVDGSTPSLVATDLAADEAERRGLPLELVHGFAPPLATRAGPMPGVAIPNLPTVPPTSTLDDRTLRAQATDLLQEAAERVRARHPDLPMISRLRDGYPPEVLVQASRQASLLLVGHRGLGGFTELLAGSVASQLPGHAACPVIVVRGEVRGATDRQAPVLVGVDGSAGARRAAEFAAEVAAGYRVPLLVLYAWLGPAAWLLERAQAGEPPPDIPPEVTETLATLADRHPEVTVRPVIRRGVPTHEALVAASAGARLVVVGSRGRGGFRGLVLGSTSQALIHHSHAPVAVIGPGAGEPGQSG